jgi:thiosulfate dehydrogenase
MRRSSLLILAAATIGLWPCARAADSTPHAPLFQPPPDSAIPTGPFGDLVRHGEQIFRGPATYAPKFVGNQLSCSNCHFDAGRQPWVAPMWAGYVAFPEYRAKNGHVNTFAERLQDCFRFSMNGKAPPLGDQVLVALETYSYFLAKGLPTGENAPGRGYPKLLKPDLPADYARGAQVFIRHCAMCHGPQGLGISAGGKVLFPPLWGPYSFNWGAGMAEINTAAAFIRANMPYGAGGTLSVQQAWDVATYVDSQVRPQDPRFVQSVAETRRRFHDTPLSMYGLAVNGTVLGDPATTPPAGIVPGN